MIQYNQNNSRRIAIQQMMMAFAGITIAPVASIANTHNIFSNYDYKGVNLPPFIVQPTEALQPGASGLDIRTLVHSSQTNKQFSCVEFAVAAKKMGPAPHYHKKLDELMYVIEGTATVMVEDTVYEIPAGGWHFRPRKMVHTFFNTTNKPFRGIDMYFNQNFEDFLEEVIHKMTPEMWKNNKEVMLKRIDELHKQFGMVSYPEKRQAIIDKYGLVR